MAPLRTTSFKARYAGVVPAHVADLHEPATARHLGLDDPQTCLLGGGQRLLAEDRLARLNRCEHELLMGRPPRRDEHRIDAVVVDDVLPGVVNSPTGQALGHFPCPAEVDVGHRHHLGS